MDTVTEKRADTDLNSSFLWIFKDNTKMNTERKISTPDTIL
jgi:hypothetical protein